MNSSSLLKISPFITKVVDGQNLTSVEAERTFTTIFIHDKAGLYFAVFLAALHAKGETADELLGLAKTLKKLGTNLAIKTPQEKNIDLSGTGGGSFKTINVSTTASFVVAAARYTVGKDAYWGISSTTGSADIFEAFGIPVARLTPPQVEQEMNNCKICPFVAAYLCPRLKNFANLARNMYQSGINIRSALHLVVNLYSPFPTNHRIYGCYSEKYLKTIGELLSKMGYRHSLTFYGSPGIPEISNVGPTAIVEQNGHKLKDFTLTPADLGIHQATPASIQTGGKEQNIIDFLRILQGKEAGPKSDLVAINAAAAFYVLGESKSIADSVPKAQEILKSGEGFRVLTKLVDEVGNSELLKAWLAKSSPV